MLFSVTVIIICLTFKIAVGRFVLLLIINYIIVQKGETQMTLHHPEVVVHLFWVCLLLSVS